LSLIKKDSGSKAEPGFSEEIRGERKATSTWPPFEGEVEIISLEDRMPSAFSGHKREEALGRRRRQRLKNLDSTKLETGGSSEHTQTNATRVPISV